MGSFIKTQSNGIRGEDKLSTPQIVMINLSVKNTMLSQFTQFLVVTSSVREPNEEGIVSPDDDPVTGLVKTRLISAQ